MKDENDKYIRDDGGDFGGFIASGVLSGRKLSELAVRSLESHHGIYFTKFTKHNLQYAALRISYNH